MNYQERIKALQAKRKKLEEDLKALEGRAEKSHLRHLRKIGLFELSDSEIYGLVIQALAQKSNPEVKTRWQAQGQAYLQQGSHAGKDS